MLRTLVVQAGRSLWIRGLVLALVALAAAGRFSTAAAQAKLQSKDLLGAVMEGDSATNKDVQKAIDDFLAGKFDESRKGFDTARKADPKLPPGDVMFAQLLFAANQLLPGRAILEKSVLDNPDDPEAYLNFGDLAYRERQVTDADLLFNRAYDLAGKYSGNDKRKKSMLSRALAGRSAVLEAREKWTESEKLLREALTVDAENNVYKGRLARVLFLQLDPKQAAAAYTLINEVYEADAKKETDPSKLVRPEVTMGMLYAQAAIKDIKYHDNARKLMEKAIERDPNSLVTRLMVAQWALENSELKMAKENAEAALKKDPENNQGKLQLGLVFRYLKDYKNAEKYFSEVHAASPSNMVATAQLALVLVEQPDEAKRRRAMEFAEVFARTHNNPQEPIGREAITTLAWVQFKMGEEANAARNLQVALNQGGAGSDFAYYTAEILYKNNQGNAALQVLNNVIDNTRTFPMREDAIALRDKIKRGDTAAPAPSGGGGASKAPEKAPEKPAEKPAPKK